MESVLPRLPFQRRGIFDVPGELREMQRGGDLVKVLTAAGDEAWLVTRYEEVRSLLADARLGRSHPAPRDAARLGNSALSTAGPVGSYASEQEDHARYRRRLTPAFSAKRMRLLRESTEEVIRETLDAMSGLASPVDLHQVFSMPVSLHVICRLLGVPYEDHDRFRAWFEGLAGMADLQKSSEARQAMGAYMAALAERKRGHPGEDLISDLVHSGDMTIGSHAPGSEAALDDLSYVAASLLFAGYRTTAIKIDYGAVLLLADEGQRAALRAEPALAETAVEEVLRLSSPDHPLLRYAREDLVIAGTAVRAGEAVLLSTLVANRDPSVFPEPDAFDIARDPNPHLSFGHGPRLCIGTTLARIEIAAALRMLFERFPSLRLSVPHEELTRRTDMMMGGLSRVPVEW
ncbi:cytochrome P450 [Streptomyces sp. PTY087I2]|uniref:cytochrome P450 n=1 Tax=Streptomyces sp. PTY087I2 TaxID=1819298 RepID=UPI00080BF6E5|nr:cytochrome P450 [Streptomyces sp. PTY087I2]OCC09394.1 Pentalenolactone synthase [Streptomyces sp. PTY087I2]